MYRSLALTMEAGMLPVRLLVLASRVNSELLLGMVSGRLPVRLLLLRPIMDSFPGLSRRQSGMVPVNSMLPKSRYCSPFCKH